MQSTVMLTSVVNSTLEVWTVALVTAICILRTKKDSDDETAARLGAQNCDRVDLSEGDMLLIG